MADETLSTKLKRCFVIGPIGADSSETRRNADNVLMGLIEPSLKRCGLPFEVARADRISDPGPITEQVINAVIDADLVIADLSERNPNAFYELGVRHAVERPVINLIGVGSELPFDTKDYRAIRFDPLDFAGLQQKQDELVAQIISAMDDGYKVSNPVSQALGAKKLRLSGDTRDQLQSEMIEQLRGLTSRIDRLESSTESSRFQATMQRSLGSSAPQPELRTSLRDVRMPSLRGAGLPPPISDSSKMLGEILKQALETKTIVEQLTGREKKK